MGIDLGRFKSKRDDEWADWLADDPVPASMRQRMRAKAVAEASRPIVRRPGQTAPSPAVQTTPAPQNQASQNATHSVSINISVPKFKKPQLGFNRLKDKLPEKLPANLTYKQLGIGSAALVSVLLIGVITVNIHNGKAKNKPGSTGVLGTETQHANFATISPKGKGAEPSEEKYDAKRKVVSFRDSIGGVDITVSQQQLPESLKDNRDDKVKKLAEGFSATKVLSTANPTAYLGNDVKGPQTVIFTKKDLLVFIFSTKPIDDHDWAEYITNLQ